MMSVGERIKVHRKKSGISQERIAELVGVSRQAVTKWESGLSAPSTENLFKLAEIFGTTVDMPLDIQEKNRSVQRGTEQIKELTAQIQYLYHIEAARKAEAERIEIESEKRWEWLQSKSNKVWRIQILFVLTNVIAAIPLSIAVFDDTNPAVISICGAIIGIALLGNLICALIRAYWSRWI